MSPYSKTGRAELIKILLALEASYERASSDLSRIRAERNKLVLLYQGRTGETWDPEPYTVKEVP